MHWAWDQRLPPSLKLVLMALADAADDEGQCWPSVRTIAVKCCISERTVQRVMKEFKAMGLLLSESRQTSSGRQTSNCYFLNVNCYPDKLSPSHAICRGEGDKGVAPGVTELCHPPGDTAVSPLEPPYEPTNEPQQQPATEKAKSLELPQGLSDAEKLAIAELLKQVDQAVAQLLLDELAGAMQSKGTIKTSPMRWFRALVERMHKGQFYPAAGVRITQSRATQSHRAAQTVATNIAKPVSNPALREAAMKSLAESRRYLASKAAGTNG